MFSIHTAAALAGGHIRNAVLTAAMIARSQARPIEYAEALADAYWKLGLHPIDFLNKGFGEKAGPDRKSVV